MNSSAKRQIMSLNRRFYPLIKILALRAGPGFLNLASLLYLAEWLDVKDYGLYSTLIVSTGFLANITFGPITFAIISQYAGLDSKGLGKSYESSLISIVLIIAMCVIGVGFLIASLSKIPLLWVMPIVSFGIFQAVQEILHAQLRIITYSIVALIQAITYAILIWSLVYPNANVTMAVLSYTLSYTLGALISLKFVQMTPLTFPNLPLLKSTLVIGSQYTLSKIAENSLSLGFRYAIVFLGNGQQLGVFSFCLDLAQRLIGFILSSSRFLIIPQAFIADAKDKNKDKDNKNFYQVLMSGTMLALFVCSLAFIMVLLIRQSGFIAVLKGALFEPWVFAIISMAVVLNQTKKAIFDPLAMRAKKTATITIGYAVSAPLTLFICFICFNSNLPYVIEFIFLGGYVLATFISIVAFMTLCR